MKRIASQIALALNISGPFNIQFLAKDNMVKVIECNLRASRTFPFISKTFDSNFITLATKVMLGYPCKPYSINLYDYDYVAVKAPMFSFTRLRGADPTLGVEMSSTGEVACFGRDVQEAFLQALLASNFNLPQKLPNKYILVSIAEDSMRAEFLLSMQMLHEMGYQLACTPGTAEYYAQQGITVISLNKPSPDDFEGGDGDASGSGDKNTVLKWIRNKTIDLVINIPEGTTRTEEISAGYLMRRAAVDFGTSLLTNVKCAALFCEALHRNKLLPCKSSEEFIGLSQVGFVMPEYRI